MRKRVFQIPAPTDPKSLSGSTLKYFQLKFITCTYNVRNLQEKTSILFKKILI